MEFMPISPKVNLIARQEFELEAAVQHFIYYGTEETKTATLFNLVGSFL